MYYIMGELYNIPTMQFMAEYPENSGVNIFDDKIDRVCLGITK